MGGKPTYRRSRAAEKPRVAKELQAEMVSIEINDLNIQYIWFVADWEQPELFVIQRDLDSKEAGYHVEYCDQSYSCYGGVESLKLSQSSLVIHFNAHGKSNLEIDRLHIEFEVADDEIGALRDALQATFTDGELLD